MLHSEVLVNFGQPWLCTGLYALWAKRDQKRPLCKMQIKTTMRYHLILVRMAITKNQQTAWASMWRKGPSCTAGGMYIGAATVDNSMEAPQKIYTKLPYLAIPLLDIYLKKFENICASLFYCSFIYNSQDIGSSPCIHQ